ncbi:hypothetical protein G8T75_12830 [Clostridium botulinum D/C]|uniref:hypothetical protein n=1 Tax=Clostridium botulinum TaxID=1491 RepID=UPI001E394DC1|nr:hypothetical protein [Clostridium botulinum]MCD3240842.1 hypothetical protein [Clostridium botulinum D/C]
MIKENVYIMNIEAKWIIKEMEDNEQYTIKNKNIKKIYGASLPYSLDLIQLQKITENEIYKKDNKYYTNAIINITFEENMYHVVGKDDKNKDIWEQKYKTKELRQMLYKDGFIIDGIKYVKYKRSSAKARLGSCLFIKENLYNDMINWSRINIKFEENETVDLASLKAYESLTLSSIEDTVKIKANEILLISDIDNNYYTTYASLTNLKSNIEPYITNDKEFKESNDIFDGESLIDNSIFKQAKREDKGMMLLRNRFTKTCGFNTKIQQFLMDNCPDSVNFEDWEIKDMFGNEVKAKDIKMILTPNSLKIFKFAYKISDNTDEFTQKKDTWKYYLDNLEEEWGICKSEHASFYGNYNKLTYQIINSMDFTRDEIKELAKDEIHYIDMLKNNLAVFKEHIGLEKDNISKNFMLNLLNINDEVQDTQMFKDFRADTINIYMKNLKKGKIKIANTDYATLFGNPYEYLLHAIGKKIDKSILKGRQVWCSKYQDGEELACFRNPHICSGNCLVVTNTYRPEFKYFNLTDNIVVINPFDNDIFNRLSGADEDSDTMLITSNSTILKRAKECMSYPTPINQIKIPKTSRKLNINDEVEIDYLINKGMIGEIVNWSQIFQSYYWDLKSKGYTIEELEGIYNQVSILSSLSQCEIDKAKKFIEKEKLDISKILKNLHNLEFKFKENNEDNKLIRRGDILVNKKEKKISDKEKGELEIFKIELDKLKCEIDIIENKMKSLRQDKKRITSISKKERTQKQEAKKESLNVNIQKLKSELNVKNDKIKSKQKEIDSITKEEKEVMIKPLFFKYCAKNNRKNDKAKNNCKYEHFNTPMDYLIDVLSKDIPQRNRNKTKDINAILKVDYKDRNQVNKMQIRKIKELVKELDNYIKHIRAKEDSKDNKKEDKLLINHRVDEVIKTISNYSVYRATIINIFNRIYSDTSKDEEIREYKMLLLSILWKAKTQRMMDTFKQMRVKKVAYLEEDEKGDIQVFDKRYTLKYK